MRFEVDPIWPWSELNRFLADSADPVVVLLIWATGVLALVLPLVLTRANPLQRRNLLAGSALWFVVQFIWVARAAAPTPGVGLAEQLRNASLGLLLIVPMGLIGLMLRTYLLAPALTRRRLLWLVALRMAAVVCCVAAVARPYLGFPDSTRTRAVLVFLIDDSESMTIQDEAGSSRWDRMLRALKECEPHLARLVNEQGIDAVFYRFARDAGPWQLDSPGKPEGKRTDIGAALRWLYDNRDRRPLRGLFVVSDGRNNGRQSIAPLTEVRRWRKLGCPVHTVLLGSPNTPNGQQDIAVTRVTPASSLVQVKSEMVALARIDAPGFEGFKVKVRVFIDGKEVNDAKIETLQHKGEDVAYEKSEDGQITLKETRNNEVRIRLSAPDQPGEYKLTVRVDDPRRRDHPLPDERNAANNEASTLISAIKGGISVLLVDRQRAGEPQLIFDDLKSDPRVRPRVVWLGKAGAFDPAAKDLFNFAQQKYDVIILGDVTAAQMRAVNPSALDEIVRLVDGGAGLVMLGGYSTFGNGDWKGTPLEPLLPVELTPQGEVEEPIRVTPTEQGLRLYGYVLGLAGGTQESRAAWARLPVLDGMMKLKHRQGPLVNVLATARRDKPRNAAERAEELDFLVAQNYGKGRVLAFAGDTTYRWTGTPEGRLLHSRFWRQMTVWLAQQEGAGGNVWVKPDVRDVPVGTDVGFTVGVRNKGGIDLPNGVFEVDVLLPNKQLKRVSTARTGSEDRGVYRPEVAGEYTIKVTGSARDPEGNLVSGTGEARFLAHEEDVEMAEWSADKAFMDKLAKEGRGRAATAAELPGLLRDLLAPTALDNKAKLVPWPDWRSTKKSSFLPLFALIFVGVLTGEWLLRRRWGLV